MTRALLPPRRSKKSRESRWPSLCTWPRRPRGEAEPYHPFARRAGIVARRSDGFAFAMRRGDTMTRITHRPQPSGAKTVHSPGKPARRAVATLALALLCSLAASEAGAVIAFVKNIGTNSSATTGTTIAVTAPAAGVATGDSIILTLAMADASGGVSAIDAKGNTYSVAADVTNASNVRTVILAAHNVTALVSVDTITVTHPSASLRALSANEFSGLSPTSALDQTHTATGSSTAPSSGATAATTEAAELLLGAMGVAGTTSDTFTAGASYTALAQAGTPTIGFCGATFNSSSAATTSLSLSRPSATVANDIMLASVTARASSVTMTAPGWTAIVTTSDSVTNLTTATFRKVAGTAAADPGPYSFSISSSSQVAGGISSYFNVDTTNPINAFLGQVSSSAPSITTTVVNTRLVAFFGRAGNQTIGAPSDMGERFNALSGGGASSAAGSESADRAQAAIGATGAEASTTSTATIGQLIALT